MLTKIAIKPDIMKNSISSLFLSILLFTILGCRKNKICRELPEGDYSTYFAYDNNYTGTEKNPFVSEVSLSKIHTDTYIGDANSGFTKLKIQDCNIGGVIQGHSCVGEIRKDKDRYIIEGVFTYPYNTSGVGNPNFVEVPGEFELISK
jgi:hypothetical protein